VEGMSQIINNLLVDWASALESKIRSSSSKYGFASKIKVKVAKKNADFRVFIQLPRYAILRHKGVGKGRGMQSGKTKPDPFLDTVVDVEIVKITAKISNQHMTDFIQNTQSITR
jgi:hypothetical protein